jgi:hypothetical protein
MAIPPHPETRLPPKPLRASALPLPVSPTAALGVNAPRPLTAKELVAKLTTTATVQVTAGPLTLSAQSDPSRGQALVTVILAGTTVLTQVLMLGSPALTLDVAAGGVAAKGSITLQIRDPPQFSSVTADVVATQGAASFPFKGMVDSWTATALPVVGDYVAILTGELKTLTTVRGKAANFAEFQFYSAATPIAVTNATQFAPIQIFPSEIIAGDIKIDSGAQVTLSIPTEIAPGFLFLQATFSSSTTHPTRISSSVALWPLPPSG